MTLTIYSDSLKTRDYSVVNAPLAVFCSDPDCNSLIRAGQPAKRFDAATFTHISCSEGKPKHTAAHKHPDTGLRLGGESD